MRLATGLVILLLFCRVSFAQKPPAANSQSNGPSILSGSPELQKRLQQILQWQISFASNSASTGATIELRELGREYLGDRTFVKYELSASGVSAKERYTVMRWNLHNSLEPIFKDARVRDDGTLLCSGTTVALCGTAKPADPLNINFYGTAGEALSLALTTATGKPLATTSITPFPLASKDRGCKLSAILLMQEAAAFFVEGEGFTPNATVSFATNSSGEKKNLVHEADAHGYLQFVILPSTIGHESGTITVRPNAGPCHPQVTVPWGKHSYKLQ